MSPSAHAFHPKPTRPHSLNPRSSVVLFWCLLVSFHPTPSLAYIPQSSTIISRTVRNHGKGGYLVEQEVSFHTTNEPLVLRERWWVENGEHMRLTVSGTSAAPQKQAEPIRFESLYSKGQRSALDVNGGRELSTSPAPAEFIESFFHERTSASFMQSLLHAHIVPASFVHERIKPTKLEQIRHIPEPQVRLSRVAGVVAWVFGEPSPVDGKANPEVWIEQDAFVLRRLRFPSEAELSTDRISNYPNGLKFPRERTLTWDNNTVTIRVLSIKSVQAAQLEKVLEPSAFARSARAAHLPEMTQVREFYSRFR